MDLTATVSVPVLYFVVLFLLFQADRLPYIFMQHFSLTHVTLFVFSLLLLTLIAYGAYRKLRAWRWREAQNTLGKKYV